MNTYFPSKQASATKLFSSLVGLVALTVSATAISPAFSQSAPPNSSPAERHQLQKRNPLNLTSQQQAQMKQIRQSTKEQMDSILTADQKAQLQAARANRNQPRGFASLNLTTEQRTKMQAVMQSSKQKMDAILTPEQRQQLQQFEQQHQQRHRQAPPEGVQPPN